MSGVLKLLFSVQDQSNSVLVLQINQHLQKYVCKLLFRTVLCLFGCFCNYLLRPAAGFVVSWALAGWLMAQPVDHCSPWWSPGVGGTVGHVLVWKSGWCSFYRAFSCSLLTDWVVGERRYLPLEEMAGCEYEQSKPPPEKCSFSWKYLCRNASVPSDFWWEKVKHFPSDITYFDFPL